LLGEGGSPAVVRVIAAIDAELLAVRRALGGGGPSFHETSHGRQRRSMTSAFATLTSKRRARMLRASASQRSRPQP
jgi:hypothetical protein